MCFFRRSCHSLTLLVLCSQSAGHEY